MKTINISLILILFVGILTVTGTCDETYTFPVLLCSSDGPLTCKYFGFDTDTTKGRYMAHVPNNQIDIIWHFRPGTQYNFKQKTQTLTASYTITDTFAPSHDLMFVVGVTDSGQTRVERWQFTHKPVTWSQPASGGDLVWNRNLPTIRRIELYSGDDLTTVASMTVDPQLKNIVLFTWESKTVYKIDAKVVTTTPTYLVGPSENSKILNFRRLDCYNHKTEGYIYLFNKYPSANEPLEHVESEDLVNIPIEEAGEVYVQVEVIPEENLIFRDADKNGIIDTGSLEVVSRQDWLTRKYYDSATWN